MLTHKLAIEFGRVLHSWLDVQEMVEIINRNREQRDDNICHTHDFCDANMAMEEAFQNVLGRGAVVASWEDNLLWNESWSLAKRYNFFSNSGYFNG